VLSWGSDWPRIATVVIFGNPVTSGKWRGKGGKWGLRKYCVQDGAMPFSLSPRSSHQGLCFLPCPAQHRHRHRHRHRIDTITNCLSISWLAADKLERQASESEQAHHKTEGFLLAQFHLTCSEHHLRTSTHILPPRRQNPFLGSLPVPSRRSEPPTTVAEASEPWEPRAESSATNRKAILPHVQNLRIPQAALPLLSTHPDTALLCN
jgi:hypothetical protein